MFCLLYFRPESARRWRGHLQNLFWADSLRRPRSPRARTWRASTRAPFHVAGRRTGRKRETRRIWRLENTIARRLPADPLRTELSSTSTSRAVSCPSTTSISHLQGVEKTNEAIHILESGECLGASSSPLARRGCVLESHSP